MELQGRIGIITGGGVRVGRAIALGLAGSGVDVFIHYNRSAGPAEETAEAARSLGVRAAIGSVDLSDPSTTGALIDLAEESLGSPSILVNSASGFPTDTIRDVALDDWRATLDLTLGSPVFATQAFANALPAGMDGAVVNITDVRTHTPYREHFSYLVAKGGIDTFTRAAALQLAPRIRVNAVALGVILPPKQEDADYALRLAADLPLGRVGGTDPVVAAVLALIENDFVTGEIVRIDGGGHLV
ncbi:MAG TPA: SDR family oxidoreductase [Acidimicrobiia bacterium]|nr:SDR family oxidoreductase [Acidimicrobiia bacterium]